MRLLDLIRNTFVIIYQRVIYPLVISRFLVATNHQQQTMTVTNNTNSPFKSTNMTIATTTTSAYNNQMNQTSGTSTFARFFSSAFSSSPYGSSGDSSSLLSLNNMLKWFYLNLDTTHRINQTILNILNFNFAGSGQRPMSVRFQIQ